MGEAPSLQQFTEAMSNFAGADVTDMAWLGREIGADRGEADWLRSELTRMLGVEVRFTIDLDAYLPDSLMKDFPDIRVRELYAYTVFGDERTE